MKVFLVLTIIVVAHNSVQCVNFNRWTKWYNRDLPSGNADYEALAYIRSENPNDNICATPVEIQAETLNGISWENTGQTVHISPTFGFACYNSENIGACQNYRVRFGCLDQTPSCPAGNQWTGWYDRDNYGGSGDWEILTNLRSENPGQICANPSAIDIQQTNGLSYTAAGQIVSFSPDVGFFCRNNLNVGYCKDYKVRLCCPN